MFKKYIYILIFFLTPFPLFAQQISVNEVLVYGQYANDEFVELLNTTETSIDISNWSIQYKTKTGKVYKKNFPKNTTVPAKGFYLISHKDYSKNNIADMTHSSFAMSSTEGTIYIVDDQKIIENDQDENIIDKIHWSKNIATANKFEHKSPENSFSINRDKSNSYLYVSSPSPKSTNLTPEQASNEDSVVSSTDTTSSNTSKTFLATGKIIINEIFPNPEGKDDNEWIEIKSIDTKTIDLNGWKIKDLSREYTISSDGLPNTLINPNGFYVFYKKDTGISLNNNKETLYIYDKNGTLVDSVQYTNAPENESLSRDEEQNFIWSTSPTPGDKNIISIKNTNNSNTNQNTQKNTNTAQDVILSTDQNNQTSETETDNSSLNYIKITEIMPNPEDKTEWIEIQNTSDNLIENIVFKIKDASGKSSSVEIKKLNPQEYHVIYQNDLKIQLNNKGDIVDLLTPDEQLLQSVSYPTSPKGKSYSLINNIWNWTEPTPLKENTLSETSKGKERKTNKQNTPTVQKIEEIKLQTNGKDVIIYALIGIKPKQISKTYFYVFDETGGVQIKKRKRKLQIPNFDTYDYVKIQGKTYTENDEIKINLYSIEKLDTDPDIETSPQKTIQLQNIQKEDIGDFVSITGEITKKTKTYMYIDDQTDEIRVYTKNIETKKYNLGDLVEINGFLSKTASGIRIIPISKNDIKIKSPQVLGAKTVEIKEKDNKDYVFIIIFVIMLISGLLIKKYARIYKRGN